VRPPLPGRACCGGVTDLIAEIRHLDRRLATDISVAVAAGGSTLTELRGLGDLTAGKNLGPGRGSAPVSLRGGVCLLHRHRPHRGLLGRYRAPSAIKGGGPPVQLLPAHHGTEPNQTRQPRAAYYLAKLADAKGQKEAMRWLKRRLSDLVYRQLLRDTDHQVGASPGGHQGATTKSSAAGSTPTTDSSDQSLPGPASEHHTTPHQDRLD
jgi:hypothetical protein